MTKNEELTQMTLEERAEFLSTQRFLGMGVEFIIQWLESEAK